MCKNDSGVTSSDLFQNDVNILHWIITIVRKNETNLEVSAQLGNDLYEKLNIEQNIPFKKWQKIKLHNLELSIMNKNGYSNNNI